MPNPLLNRRLGGGSYPNLAAAFAAASTQYGSVADNATLSMGAEIDFSLACWVMFDSLPASDFGLMAKQGGAGAREYMLYRGATNQLGFVVSDNGSNQKSIFSTTVVTAGIWYFFAASHDATSNQIMFWLNGAQDAAPVAHTTGGFDGAQALTLGRYNATNYLDGRMDCAGLWRTAAAGGGALTSTQVAKLYKGGVGRAYRDLDVDLKTGLVSYWDMDGSLNDSHGANNLTNNGGVSFTAGKR